MNDTHPQQHAKEEIAGIPTFFTEDVAIKTLENVREPSLNPSLDQQFSKLNYHRNSTISAAEKSFKDEELIYVGIFFPSIWISKTIAISIIG